MIDKASAKTRIAVAMSRCQAIGGQIDNALTTIDARLTDRPLAELDQVALLMAKAEYLHLDNCDAEAFEIIQRTIEPLLSLVSDEVAVIVGYNRADVAIGLLQPDDFYGTVDLSTNLALTLWDHERLFLAQRAADAGKHYESLPAVWRELHRTYLQGCWAPFRFASSHMAIECLKLGWPHEAAYHAILARDDNTVKAVGQQLARIQDSTTVGRSVQKVLSCSQLQRYFVNGARLLLKMHDSIPDELIAQVFEWSLSRAALVPTAMKDRETLTVAWDFLGAIAGRLDGAQATALIDTALNHPVWPEVPTQPNQVILFRKEMLKAMRVVFRVCDSATLNRVIEATIPLTGERKQEHDYADAIEVLCQIGEVGGSEIKEQIRQLLYPKGQRLNALLLHVAKHFGQEINKPVELSLDAARVADDVRLQVQHVAIGEEVKKVNGTYFTQHCEKDGVQHVVSNIGGNDVVAILGQKDVLPDKALRNLVNAVLDMIENPDNSISNKTVLVYALKQTGDKCQGAIRQRLWNVLSTLSAGEIAESPLFMSAADAANPLNPFKMSSGKPTDLQAAAIYSLACLDSQQPGAWTTKLNTIVTRAIGDAQPEVRIAACHAVEEMSVPSSATLYAVLFATRDPESKVVEAAFSALAEKATPEIGEAEWQLICTSCERAALNSEARVRRAAAIASARLVDRCALPDLKKRLEAVRKVFCRDVCHSVRRLANAKPNGPPKPHGRSRRERAKPNRSKPSKR